MILWSSRKLEHLLASGQLASWAKVKYLIVPAVLGSLATPFYVLRPIYGQRAPALNALFALTFAIMSAYLVYWGIKRCFHINEGIDGKDFFERLAVLVVPVWVRLIVVAVPGSIALLVIVGQLRERVPILFERASIFFSALGPILTYALYSMLNRSFRRLGELVKANGGDRS
jgi:hypothetical protein